MDFGTLYGTQLDQELGSADRTQLFMTHKRKDAINLAQQWFIEQTACLQKTAEIPIVDGTATYNLQEDIDDDAFLMLAPNGPEIFITYADLTTRQIAGKNDFPRRTIPWLNSQDDGWRSAEASTPMCWYDDMDGAAYLLGLYPPPSVTAGDTWTLRVPYVVQAAEMVNEADLPFTVDGLTKTMLAPWHRTLAIWAASELEKLRKGVDRSALLLAQANALVADYLGKQQIPQGRTMQLARNYRSRRGAWPWVNGEQFGRTW